MSAFLCKPQIETKYFFFHIYVVLWTFYFDGYVIFLINLELSGKNPHVLEEPKLQHIIQQGQFNLDHG